jgi:hypothetical protein
MGHRIPVELICSLSYTGRPSEGLKIFSAPEQGTTKVDAGPTAGDAVANSSYLWVLSTAPRKHSLLTTVKDKMPSPNLLRTKDWTLK